MTNEVVVFRSFKALIIWFGPGYFAHFLIRYVFFTDLGEISLYNGWYKDLCVPNECLVVRNPRYDQLHEFTRNSCNVASVALGVRLVCRCDRCVN